MSDELRLFFGIELGDAARSEALRLVEELAADAGGDGVRWVRPEALHVTLRFLGATPAERVGEIVDHVRRESADCAPFELRLGALDAFPNPRRPRVVVLELTPEAPLVALADAVERGAVAAGFAPETRRFRGHVTLGRARNPRRPRAPRLHGACEPAPFPVDAFVLFQSRLSSQGARYTPLERIALQGTGGAGPAQRAAGERSPSD